MEIKKMIKDSICRNHTGKMSDLISISTSCKKNTICAERAKNPGSICSKCYAQRQLSYQHSTAAKLARTYDFYTTTEIQPEDVPMINAAFCRFEAFGDIQNTLHFQNYCTIAAANSHCRFVLWTKNAHIIADYVSNNGIIPENMYIIYSTPFINNNNEFCTVVIDGLKKVFVNKGVYNNIPIDAVFTVFDKKYAADNDITINCGARHCMTCRRCYSLKHGTITLINELLK